MLAAALAGAICVGACQAPRPPTVSSFEPSSIAAPAPTARAPLSQVQQTPLPAPTERPLSTVAPIPQSDTFGAGLLYTCGGTAAFPIELLETSPSSDLNPDPTPVLVRWPVPTEAEGWWLLARTETHAEYLGRDAEGRFYESAILERDEDGAWHAVGWGGCRFYAVVPGAEGTDELGWWIRERDWPLPGDRALHVRVRTWCPRSLTDRMLEPIVRFGPDRIIAIVAARALTQGPSSCGDDQVADATIELDEPVGDRLILDAKEWPGRDAHIKTQVMLLCCG